MNEQYQIVYKISLASMNLLVPMAWSFLLLLKTAQNFERNVHVSEDWMRDFSVILLLNFIVCWVIKQVRVNIHVFRVQAILWNNHLSCYEISRRASRDGGEDWSVA